MSAASLDAQTRTEFDSAIERLVERMTALESTVSQLSRPGTRDVERTAEVVTQNEFRLFKWLGSFSLAAMLAGFGFLFQQTADLRVDVEREFADLRVDVERQFADLRVEIERQHRDLLQEMNAQFVDLRREIGLLSERVTGAETRAPT